jgi:hypothetical protein
MVLICMALSLDWLMAARFAWFAPVSLGLGGLAALGSIKHDVCLRVNTMFKQICNFARPGVAQAQKNRPDVFTRGDW